MSTNLRGDSEKSGKFSSLDKKQNRLCDKFLEFIMRKFHRTPLATCKTQNCEEMNTVVST